ISTGGSIGSQFAGNMTSALLAGGGSKGHAEGTTQSAVSEGTIIIRDQASQKQDVADLSRDTEHASGSIGPIFDKEKEQRRLQEVQLTGEIGSQAADIARTQGEIAKQKAIKDPAALTAAEAKLKAEGNSSPTAEQIADQAGRTAMAAYGTGSDLQRGIQAATAALQGLAGGDIAGALAGASAPELANLIGHGSGLSDGAAVVAHAILGGAVAALQGNSAAAGAAGAAAGELAAKAIAGMLYPGVTDLSTLTEAQKQTVSTLATISAGMAGGLAGNSTASAVAGAQAGKNAVDNNLLGGTETTQEKFVREHGKNIASCADNPGSASCQKGLAMQDALMVALPAGLGGGVLAAATPEIAVAAKAAIQACAGNVVLCLNSAGIQVSEAIVPGGVGAGGAIGIGKTVTEATAAKAEAVAANTAKNVGNSTKGSLSGQPTKLPPNASAENIRSLQRENEGATILSQNGYHVEQNPVTPGVKNPDYKINGEVFDNIAPKTNSVRNIYDRALEKVNSGQTNNVVINLADTKASVSDLQKQFSDWPIKGLDKVIVIDQSGKPIRIK
ncbi:VENN motif pre-toxin domain-containing protein, partial [Klebsiella pneumoniae]|uniref:CdiA C-terminal domain-containing protein n=1 Tax=Klebsiella pneumoniae TaxID=573 RepID=UPI001B8D2D41